MIAGAGFTASLMMMGMGCQGIPGAPAGPHKEIVTNKSMWL